MAKKTSKKAKTDITTPEIATTQVNSLAYQGNVTFQILHGRKVISSKKYSNSGLPELFKFIGFALAGSYYPSLRPCKVALYDCVTTGDYQDPTKFDWTKATGDGSLEVISPYVVYDATPVVKATAEGYSTTFRFKIPFNWLYKATFNTLGLFNDDNIACAYYLFTEDEEQADKTIIKKWATQGLGSGDGEVIPTGDYSIVIEWTLKISNRYVEKED
jgi:hypothetical protein